MAEWFPLLNQVWIARGHSSLSIFQAVGDAADSAGTHKQGTCVDLVQQSADLTLLMREAGAPATWRRGRAFGQPSLINHTHGALDCPCASNADYQIPAVQAGFDGLGDNGRGGRDYEPRPATWRNWEQGMAYLRGLLAPAPASNPTTQTSTSEEEDMRDLIAAAYRTYLGREGGVGELDGWALTAVKNGLSAKQVLLQISTSPEAVTAAYAKYLGRSPSPGDIAFWGAQGGLDAIVNGISSSAEAIAYAKSKAA